MRTRTSITFPIDGKAFRDKLLDWSCNYEKACWLEGTGFSPLSVTNSSRLGLMAMGVVNEISSSGSASFSHLKKFYDANADWLFGFFSYDLKNEIEAVSSKNDDRMGFPVLHFFCPEYVFELNTDSVTVYFLPSLSDEKKISKLVEKISDQQDGLLKPISSAPTQVSCRFTKEEYISTVQAIRKHIQRGDIYEMNFCMEFFVENCSLSPSRLFADLFKISPMPFSCFYKSDNRFLVCASPERFIRKEGSRIISQPMKGTVKREQSEEDDLKAMEKLRNDPKERAENIMIVDLVRNDLSKIAERNSVKVDELCGIYSFPNVHQMISTISAELRTDVHFTDSIRALFPMGSMTGAPKVRAMELIEEFERTKRGLFSGSVGYVTPGRDYDFNVVIRSMMYNSETNYLSYQAGSAITIASDPENEYKECLLKAKSLFETFGVSPSKVHA